MSQHSYDAWADLQPRLTTRQLEVLSTLKANPEGLTGREMNKTMGTTSAHKRLSELLRRRLVRRTDGRCSVSRRVVSKWTIGDPGPQDTFPPSRRIAVTSSPERLAFLAKAGDNILSAIAALKGGHRTQYVEWALGHLGDASSTLRSLATSDVETRSSINKDELAKENAELRATVKRLRRQLGEDLQLNLGV
jgi:hypothetical protein